MFLFSVLAAFLLDAGPPVSVPPTPPPTSAQGGSKGIEGAWEATFHGGSQELRVVVKFSRTPEHTLKGTLDRPDQGIYRTRLQDVTWKDDALHFAMKGIHATYDGQMSVDGSKIVGTWKQRGQSVPLTFERQTRPHEVVKRPQLPRRPYPYREEQVSYDNAKARVRLAGTLTIPRGRGPFPAALLLTGSGPQDRDETMLGHKPFLVLADYLTRRGIAVLRVDDRGVGGSTGSTPQSTTADFAGDALAGVAYLRTRKEIDPRAIGLVGHSEGGMIGPLAASRCPAIAFVVMLAGTGLPGEQVLRLQADAVMKAEGADPSKVEAERSLQDRLFDIVRHEKDPVAAETKLREVIAEQKARLSGEDRKELEDAEAGIVGQLQMVQTPWFRFFLDYDPRPALRQVHCPVLAMGGSKDLQVPARANLAAIGQALRAGGNRDYTLQEWPGLNHLFQHCQTGSVGEYSKIEETMAPEVLKRIADWILQRTGRKPWARV